MNEDRPEPDRLEAARRVADGGEPGDSGDGADAYLHNLRALARLGRAYATAGDRSSAGGPTETQFRWGHLDVTQALGQGSFSRVYRAWDTVLQREVALKLRNRPEDGELDMEARAYIDEARRLARVRHPNVLAVHGADVHDGVVGIWTDLLEGNTLEERLQREGTLPVAEVLDISRQLARALAAVHGKDVVHGDLKAANVMLEADGKAVLMDFGAGAVAADNTGPARFGTPLNMAPEQLRGLPARPSGDLYALGVLMYRMLGGGYPGQTDDIEALIDLRDRADFPAAGHLRRMPRALSELTGQLLHPEPDRRPDAARAAQAIEDIIAAPARRRRRLAVATVVVALSVGVVVASLGFFHARQAERQAVRAQGHAEAINRMLLGMMEQAAPLKSPGGAIPTRYLLQAGRDSLEHFDGLDPAIRAGLLLTLADLYNAFELETDAEAISRQALAANRSVHGADSEQARAAMVTLATTLGWLGKREEAIALLGEALSLNRASSGGPAEAADILRRRGSLATYIEDYASAREDLERALDLVRQIESPPRLLEIRILAKLSFLERYTGDYASSKRYLDRAIADLRAHRLPDERFYLAQLLQHRAHLARDADGDPETTIELQRQVLETYRELYDEPNKAIATVEYEMGSALQVLGRQAEALPHLKRALEIYQRIGHIDATATAAMTLSKAHRGLGNLDEARRLLAITAENYRATYGDSHFYIAMMLNERARLELAAGDPDAGETFARRSLEMFSETVGADHPVAGTATLALGRALLARGEWSESEAFLNRTLDLWHEHFDDDDWRVAEVTYWMGMLYAERGESEQAINNFRQALAVFDTRPQEFRDRIRSARTRLAELGDTDPR